MQQRTAAPISSAGTLRGEGVETWPNGAQYYNPAALPQPVQGGQGPIQGESEPYPFAVPPSGDRTNQYASGGNTGMISWGHTNDTSYPSGWSPEGTSSQYRAYGPDGYSYDQQSGYPQQREPVAKFGAPPPLPYPGSIVSQLEGSGGFDPYQMISDYNGVMSGAWGEEGTWGTGPGVWSEQGTWGTA